MSKVLTKMSVSRPSVAKAKISMTEDNIPLLRVNAQVTQDEHQKLKLYCVKNKTSITELVKQMIADLPV